MKTRIKICGITRLDDALAAVEAGADALGFVFADSPRRVTPQAAAEIVALMPPFVRTFGVTVDAPAEDIDAIVGIARIDVLQFHGNESRESCLAQARPVLKRIVVRAGDDAATLAGRVAAYAGLRLLVDPGSGNGESFPYALAAGLPRPFVLAGGIHPGNVAEAIRAARPDGIDVCSGVEASAGRKSRELLQALVRAVRSEDARHAA